MNLEKKRIEVRKSVVELGDGMLGSKGRCTLLGGSGGGAVSLVLMGV